MLVGGLVVDVPGVKVITSVDDARCKLPAGHWRTEWLRQVILHKTIADDPEHVIPGAGTPGGALQTIEAWAGGVDGAHGVYDYDGALWQLADLATVVTYHATVSNEWSAGFEMKEQPGGGVFQAQLDACVAGTLAACEALGIQLQMQRRGTYTGHPIARMVGGGPDMVGVFGHRLNTEQRGKWDPGEAIWDALALHGVEEFDFAKGEDLDAWKRRQLDLNASVGGQLDKPLVEDGVPGPATVVALKLAGYKSGIYALGR